MVARLKVTRQRRHRVEVAWQVKADKTKFHKWYSVVDLGRVDRITRPHVFS